ncbi:MAG TPA: SCO family protein [Gammaproteobacteria bacterium]|nr:SCO family protein [Gammaproteobacteria bacterium]
MSESQDIRKLGTLALPLLLALSAAAHAEEDETAAADHDMHAHHQHMMNQFLSMDTSGNGGGAEITIPDVRLTTQHNEEVLLGSDVVNDRIVVMDFVYTTCTTVCPVLSAIFSQVAEGLGERLGSEVVLVSLTVDPLRDTPEQLLAYSKKFGVERGWTWLTSDKSTMDTVLKQLGSYTPNFEDHPSMVLVGDGSTGEWSRFVGFPGVNQILGKVDELAAARKDMHHMHH